MSDVVQDSYKVSHCVVISPSVVDLHYLSEAEGLISWSASFFNSVGYFIF